MSDPKSLDQSTATMVQSIVARMRTQASTGLDAAIVRNIVARVVEADELEEEESAADKVKKRGEWNLIISRSRRTRWDFFMQNPQGGGFGSSSYGSIKSAIAAGMRIDWENKSYGKDKVWVILQEWDGDNYEVKKTFWLDVPNNKGGR